jgi:hypothetical protein
MFEESDVKGAKIKINKKGENEKKKNIRNITYATSVDQSIPPRTR